MVEFSSALVYFTIFGHIIDDFFVKNIHSPHFFIDKRQILDILGSVLDHGLSEWALLPEVCIVLHLRVNLIFFGVNLPSVLFKQII